MFIRRQYLPRELVGAASLGVSRQDLDAVTIEMGVAPGLRLKCSNATRQLHGTGMPIQIAFSFGDFVSVGCAVILLRCGLGYQCFDLIEAISKCFSTDCCEL